MLRGHCIVSRQCKRVCITTRFGAKYSPFLAHASLVHLTAVAGSSDQSVLDAINDFNTTLATWYPAFNASAALPASLTGLRGRWVSWLTSTGSCQEQLHSQPEPAVYVPTCAG